MSFDRLEVTARVSLSTVTFNQILKIFVALPPADHAKLKIAPHAAAPRLFNDVIS